MIPYSYKAKSMAGQTVKGTLTATSASEVAELLRQKKLLAISIQEVKKSPLTAAVGIFKKVSFSDITMFTRQISTMIAAGLPLTDALRILKTQSSPAMAGVISKIVNDVEGGSSLGDSLSKHKKVFSEVYVALVRAGESAGVLDTMMTRLAGNLEKQNEFKSKVKGAMIYPIIVVIAMIIVGIIMMVFVIPKLLEMYKNFNAELPLPTKILMSFSSILVSYWYIFLGVVGGALFLFYGWVKTAAGRQKFEEIIFKTPIIGKLQKFVILTEFTRTIGLLISAGISIVDGLKITAAAVGNSIYKNALLFASSQVEKGLPLAVPISQNPYFPPILAQMISVGEETGKVDEVLLKLSAYFESESEQGVSALTAAIEPLIMIVLGIGVGFLVIAIIMPIYNLTGSM